VTDLSGYDAFVLGSGVYLGQWLKAARELVGAHAAELAARPTWLFSSGPVGDPLRPSEDSTVDVEEIVERSGAREHRLFAGKLDKRRLGFRDRAVATALRAAEGDFRDWDEVDAWAARVAQALK
jgi:menaquinone-dependent protoporphyrinogen oxidase